MKRNRTKFKSIFLSFFLVLIAFSSNAQERDVSGTVTDDANVGIPGVNIVIKGTTNGVITDLDGKYLLKASENTTLVFSFMGYNSEEVLVGSQNKIDVMLA